MAARPAHAAEQNARPPIAEEAFLAALAAARDDVRVDMALAALVAHLDGGARALLDRLPAYDTPVPVEGVIKLALDLPDAADLWPGVWRRHLAWQAEQAARQA